MESTSGTDRHESFDELLSCLQKVHDSELGKLLSKIKILEQQCREVSSDQPADLAKPTTVSPERETVLQVDTAETSNPVIKNDSSKLHELQEARSPSVKSIVKSIKASVRSEGKDVAKPKTISPEKEADLPFFTAETSDPAIKSAFSKQSELQEASPSVKSIRASISRQGKDYSGRRLTVTPDHVRRQFTHLEGARYERAPRHIALSVLEAFVAVAIVLNAIFVGLEISWKATQEGSSCDSSNMLKVLGVFNTLFFVLFLIDLLVRIALERKAFIFSAAWRWNLFDSLVVLTMLVDQFLPKCKTPSQIKSPAALRTFRLVRVLRIFKIFARLKELREFNVVVEALTRSLFTLASCCSAIATLLYICAIILTNSNLENCNQVDNLESRVCKHFGTLGESVISLYALTLGGMNWYLIMQDFWNSSIFDFATLFMYVTFSLLIVLNTITAMLVVKEQQVSEERKKLTVREDQARERSQMVELLQRVFNELDSNTSSGISKTEFTRAFDNSAKHDGNFESWLAYFDLAGTQPDVLFDLLDGNDDGEISLKEFAAGCWWLKGAAKNIDNIKILHELAVVRQQLEAITGQDMEDVEECQAQHFKSETGEYASDYQGLSGRPMTVTSGKGLQGIKAPEHRAMTLIELQRVRAMIQHDCVRMFWVENRTGSMLRPETVDLYSLCHNHLAPVTVPDGIILNGLNQGSYEEGQIVVQIDQKSSSQLAEGKIMKVCADCSLHINVTRGRFVANRGEILVANVKRGVPFEVDSQSCWSYKEVISQTPTKPYWYCCHWWGEPVFQFVRLCEVHAQYYDLKPAQATFWICAYANNQHTLSDEIGCNPEESSFRRAMLAADGVLLVLDPSAQAFSRIWCSYELYKTICDKDRRLDIMTVKDQGEPALISEELLPKEKLFQKSHREQQFPAQLLARGLQAKLEDGNASVQHDKDQILQVIEEDGRKDGGDEAGARDRALARANSLLNSYIALRAWPFAVKHGITEDFDATRRGTMSLVDVLKNDATRTDVTLSLAHCDANDDDVHAVARALPGQLTYLYLSFEDSVASDVGACNLVMGLPSNLREVSLDFSGCTGITDVTLKCIASDMPQKVERLNLCFANCGEGITKEGAHVLASNLQRLSQLKLFTANFLHTGLDAEYKTLQKFKAILEAGFLKTMLPGQLLSD